MTATQLEHLITQVVERTTTATVVRHVDALAESYVRELLKDPVMKAQMLALLRAALTQALANLNAAAPPPPTP